MYGGGGHFPRICTTFSVVCQSSTLILVPFFEHDGGMSVGGDFDVLAEDVVGGGVELASRLQPREGAAVVGQVGVESLAVGDLHLGACELVDGLLVLGFELGEVVLVGVLVLDPGGVVGDRVFHHPGDHVDRGALLHRLSLQLGGVAEGGVEQIPVDQVPPLDEFGEGGLEDLLELLVV